MSSNPRCTPPVAAHSAPRSTSQTAALLALIPARAGSKGIPQKALQQAGGKPLILRTIETVKAANVADRIVVTTDCPQIAGFCELRGIEVLNRPSDLAADDVPLAPVIDHAIATLDWPGEVAVFQPTCPLITPRTVRKVVGEFQERGLAWAITGTQQRHIYWQPDEGPITPRVNRQQQTGAIMRESGAIQLQSPAGTGKAILPIEDTEALDIDTPVDLKSARSRLDARTIRFTVAASNRLGSGHYWRCLQLADQLTIAGHEVEWEWQDQFHVPGWAQGTIADRGFLGPVDFASADLHVYDMLDAGRRVLADRASGASVVVFEDHGQAAEWADLAVDEMVDGPRWAVLRPEFTCLPEHEVREDARRVLVTFGGTDPSRLADHVYRLFIGCHLNVRVIDPGMNAHMAQEMLAADLVITGQGRTVFEAAACGVPCLSIAANEREARHVRIPGVLYLGLHTMLADAQIGETVLRILNDKALREEMGRTSRAQIDGKGIDRIMHAIDGLLKGL